MALENLEFKDQIGLICEGSKIVKGRRRRERRRRGRRGANPRYGCLPLVWNL